MQFCVWHCPDFVICLTGKSPVQRRTVQRMRRNLEFRSIPLCDVVCFGVFPAMICYCLGMNHIPGVIILCLYCVASVIRLGYFNVMEEKRQNETSELRHYYQGLPITSMAIILPFLYLLRRGCGEEFPSGDPCGSGSSRSAVYQ